MKEAKLKSTRIPYFLYLMREGRAKLVQEDDRSLNMYYDEKKVDYEKMNKLYIFFLKHLIPIALIYFMFDKSIFQAVDNWFVPFVVLIVVTPSLYLFMYKSYFLPFYFIGIIALQYYVVSNYPHIVFDINYSFNVVSLFIYIAYLLFDMYLTYKKYVYYYLKNVTTSIQYTKGRPHLTIGFWKLKKTFYFSKKAPETYSFGFIGTFVKVPNDDEIEWSDVK